MKKTDLSSDWELRYEELYTGPDEAPFILKKDNGWIKTSLPCDIHMPLIKEGIIKEPLCEDNCFTCEWTENKSWWFKKTFDVDKSVLFDDIIELVIDSIDAKADIFLNDVYLGHHESAHYPFKKDVKRVLKEKGNLLLIRVTAGTEYYSEYDTSGLGISVSLPKDGIGTTRGDKRRIMLRKPQYVYGWDWSPRVVTCGITNEAYICSYKDAVIRAVCARTIKTDDNAIVKFEAEIENLHAYSTYEAVLMISMKYKGIVVSALSEEIMLRSGTNYIYKEMNIPDPKLWWPNNMGSQELYLVETVLEINGHKTSYPSFDFALRTIKLCTDKISSNDRMFYFVINGKSVFCKGGNWIPADAIYARITDEKYDHLIKEAKEANFNMLRIWGGGIYEKEVFYKKCDEYGILVWHDFMFACALYPDKEDWFCGLVEKETDYQTRRLRNHACIALWCGNNENHWGFDEWWIADKKPRYPGGAYIYNELIPKIVNRNCPDIPYWNSSPYGGISPNGNDCGDRHHWHDCTMNPDMTKRITPEEYDKVSSKFISEYGYIGPCVRSSITRYHGTKQTDVNGRIWKLHNNTYEQNTVPEGIRKHYKDPNGLSIDEYLLYAGLCQGLMLGYSLESIRFSQNCMGSLFWMYNDCWGEAGWTIIDYYLKRKPSYYFVKRAFAPKKLIIRSNAKKIEVMGVNDTRERIMFLMEYGVISLDGITSYKEKTEIILDPCTKSVIFEFDKPDIDLTRNIIYAKPAEYDLGIAPAIYRAKDFKDLLESTPRILIKDIKTVENDYVIHISSDEYAHAVHFDLDDSVLLSDEYFDMLPGELKEIIIYDCADRIAADDIAPKYVSV